jgi:putative ATP-dependent endonuclease of OLD family
LKISKVCIKNYRNFENFEISFTDGFQTIIGENNIGKSNFYQAVRLVLDKNLSYRDRYLDKKDFHGFENLSIDSHIIISIELEGEDLASFPNLHALNNGERTAKITYIFAHKSKYMVTPDTYEDIKIEDFGWRLYGGGNFNNLDDILTLGEIHFRDIEGINLFYITAFRNIYNDIQGKSKSLLNEYCKSRPNKTDELERVKDILSISSTQLNDLDFIPNIKETVESVHKEIVGNDFSFPLSLEFQSDFDEDVWNQLNLNYESNGKSIPIHILGLGQKNIIYLSLFLAKLKNDYSEHELNLLLVEEPESHLHPQLEKILFSNLQDLQNIQVFMTSHSTHIASDCEYKNLNIIYKTTSNQVKSFSPFTSNILVGREPLFLKRYLDATRSELFFASGVIFVEGIAEQFLIPEISKKVYGINLIEHNISVISIHCRYFDPFLKLLQANGFEIPASVIIDGDENEVADGETETTAVQNAKALEVTDRIKVFDGDSTLETDLFYKDTVNESYLRDCFINLNHQTSYNNLLHEVRVNGNEWKNELIKRIDGTVKKGRFAQELSLLIDDEFIVPDYIKNAIKFVVEARGIEFRD